MVDTIVAPATPPGRGGVAIIRISGPLVPTIASQLLGRCPKPRLATLSSFYDSDGEPIDDGIVLYFPAPHSFTGEHVLELQGHGGPVVVDALVNRILLAGARMARPGEFSERAFLNDKIDLTQAEAIADIIDAASTQAARSAHRSLQGVFSQKITTIVDGLIELRKYVEASIDFAEEEIDFLSDGKIETALSRLVAMTVEVMGQAKSGAILREGITCVIAGKPNVGKSSLLNALSGHERAIVTDIAGTTRDLLKEQITIDGIPLHIIDTAGLRQCADVVEQEGIRRARTEITACDHVLFLMDATQEEEPDWSLLPDGLDNNKVTLVYNKIDLVGQKANIDDKGIWLSAKTEAGLTLLKTHLKDVVGYDAHAESLFTARRRHVNALEIAQQHLTVGLAHCQNNLAGELVAEECRLAQNALCEITGVFTSEDLLDKIFSSFCIGK